MEEQNPPEDNFKRFNETKIRDLEDKQGTLKDRVLLVGKNLVEIRERNNQDILELKKEIEMIKENIKRIKNFIEIVSNEISKFAKKEDLEILSKQAKIFQPLEFVRKTELKKMINEFE